MKRLTYVFIVLLSSSVLAQGDLTHFRWEYDIPLNTHPSSSASSLVYCSHTYGYITRTQHDELARYQRANVNMSLTVNDDYIDSPCVPDEQ